MLNLTKFNNNYVLKIKGLSKDTYFESWNHGEGEHNASFYADYLDAEFVLNNDNITKEHLTELIVRHLQKNLYSNEINKEWIGICDDRILLQTYEIDNHYSSEIITGIKEHEEKGEQVYSCHYDFYIFINGKKLNEDDLIEFFDFEY